MVLPLITTALRITNIEKCYSNIDVTFFGVFSKFSNDDYNFIEQTKYKLFI